MDAILLWPKFGQTLDEAKAYADTAAEAAIDEANEYTDTRIDSIIPGFDYKGSVATVADLPTTGNTKGDCYNVEDGSGVYAWDGDSWGSASKEGPIGPTGPQGPKGDPGTNTVSVSGTGTSTNKVRYITIDGTESKMGEEVSVSATGTSTNLVKYITIDGVESKIDSEAFKPMKSAWTGSNLSTSQAAAAILADASVKAGDAFAGGVSWNDLGEIGLGNGEATARVGDNKSFVLFTMSSSDTPPYEWNWNSYADEWRSYVPIIDELLSDSAVSALSANQGRVLAGMIDDVEDEIPDVINAVNNTSTTDALSANMGKELQDQVNNLKNIGRFLSIWNAATGAPTSEPTTSPYTYKVGDYYRIGTAGTRNPAGNSTYTTGGTNWVTGDELGVGDVVYVSNISGSTATWVRQTSGGGGTVQDVQINGTTIIESGTGIANIPNSSASVSGVMTSTQYNKLDGIEAGAQVNDLEGVQINGTDLTITNKKVNIPLSSAANPGVVKISPNEYFTDIDASGKLKGAGKTYQQYSTQGMGPSIICKETLENVLDNESVRFDKAVTLTSGQKTQARSNIGAAAPMEIEFYGEDD